MRISSSARSFTVVMLTIVSYFIFSFSIAIAADVPDAPEPSDPSDFCSSVTTPGSNVPSYCIEYSTTKGAGSDPVNDPDSPITGRNSILATISRVVLLGAGVISVIMIVIGGFRYVVSGGDSSATKGAKETILYALIGLVVAISAQVIVTFILSRL